MESIKVEHSSEATNKSYTKNYICTLNNPTQTLASLYEG